MTQKAKLEISEYTTGYTFTFTIYYYDSIIKINCDKPQNYSPHQWELLSKGETDCDKFSILLIDGTQYVSYTDKESIEMIIPFKEIQDAFGKAYEYVSYKSLETLPEP